MALDLGTSTGWAYRTPTRFHHGTQRFEVKRGESPGMRYVRFNRWIRDMGATADEQFVELVAYEMPHNRGGAATEISNGFSTRVQEFCAEIGCEHVSVHSATLKKWTTGKGNADKRDMVAAVNAKWCAVETDDEADAVALLHYVEANIVATHIAGQGA